MSIRRHFNYLLTAEGDNLCEYILCEKDNADELNDEESEQETVLTDKRKPQGFSYLNIVLGIIDD